MQLQDIPYSAKISRVFNFNENFLTRDVHARYAVNSRNYFNEIFKNRYSRKFRRYTVCTCMYQHVQSSSVMVSASTIHSKLLLMIPVLVCSEEELYKAWVCSLAWSTCLDPVCSIITVLNCLDLGLPLQSLHQLILDKTWWYKASVETGLFQTLTPNHLFLPLL